MAKILQDNDVYMSSEVLQQLTAQSDGYFCYSECYSGTGNPVFRDTWYFSVIMGTTGLPVPL